VSTERKQQWVELADAKLAEVGVDTSNVGEVREALSGCVAGRRLFQFWAEVHVPMVQIELPMETNHESHNLLH
jgi:hypothetical protein